MTHAITLTDGTTTVNLFSATGTFPTGWKLAALEEGKETVGEAIDLLIQATSIANLQTAVRSIEALVEAAVRREKTRVGPRVYLTVQWDGEADVWRSEVVAGRLEVTGAAEQYSRMKVEASLGITRRAWWEGPETPITLANGNGSNNTGLQLYNCNDGSGSSPTRRHNYAQIAAGAITGVLPAPVKVEIKQNLVGTMLLSGLYMATNADSDPANLVHMIEAEDRYWGGTVTADGACSGGSKVVFSAYTGSAQAYWNLDSAIIQKTAGRWFRLLLAVRSRNATAAQMETIQADLRDSTGVNVLWRGPEVPFNAANTAGDPLVDLGAFPLPPGSSAVAYERVQLWVTLRLTSGSATTALDFMQMTPADGYRPVRIVPIGILAGDVLVDDGIDDASYATANGYRGPFLRTFGEPLVVWPGKLQRIYVLTDCETMDYSITDRYLMRAWYRPRRLSI